MKYLITSIIIFVTVNQLSAQTIINNSSTPNRPYVRIGIEPSTSFYFGYQRNFDVGFLKQNLTSYAEWGTSMTRIGFNNSELKIGGILILFNKKSFNIVNNLNLSAGSVATQNFVSKKFAVANEVAMGFYKKNWFFATTIEYEKIYLNRIEHTEFYRITYYEDAEDGWYKGAGGMFQFGLEGGGTIKAKYDIQ